MKILNYMPVIGVALFAYIVWNIGIDKIIASFQQINIFFLLLGIGSAFFILFLRAIKFKMVINAHGFDESMFNCFKIWSIGLFTGLITPGRVGDFIKVFYLDDLQPFGKRLSVVIADRIIDLAVVLCSALIGVILLNVWFGYTIISFGLILGFVAAFFVGFYIFTRKNSMRKLLKPLFNLFVPGKYKEKLKLDFYGFYDVFGELKNKKRNLFTITLFNIFIWLFSIMLALFFGLAFGISFNYLFIFAVISVMVIIELIPVSVSGIGTRETFLLLVLPLVGMSKGMIISFSLVYLVFGYWITVPIGLFFWIKTPVKPKI
ncbi:MAG: flippase-like domain-containing protein [Nanoarchaeota archaeon]|nr:flippase-like domain-containing protein [Nanoarchaeota archaeon]MBU1135674.1 flippase-like domain-containing protein [Nanoarchaeota archaeon]MBU2520548.1 flippase-like domain-containing protein [Nanoarchaeota archaeon]